MALEVQPKHELPPEVAARLRMAVVLFVVVLLISLIATISYLAGRLLTPVQAAPPSASISAVAHAASDVPQPFPTVAPAVAPVVEIAPKPELALDRLPAGEAAPLLINTAAGAGHDRGTGELASPAKGTYFQVFATTIELARASVERMRKTGIEAAIAPGPSEKIFRVIIGPLDSAEEMVRTQTVLETGGYQFFLRRY